MGGGGELPHRVSTSPHLMFNTTDKRDHLRPGQNPES